MDISGQLHICEPWGDLLARAGLDSFDALMNTTAGDCLSSHQRGQTWRLRLPDGRTIFLKRDSFTMFKEILTDLCHGRRPEPLSLKERLGLSLAAAVGIRVPEPLAWGQRRRGGLPFRGVLVMTELAGKPLDKCLACLSDSPKRREILRAVGATVGKLYRAGLSWPDLMPKHVFIDEAGTVGLLDLERLRSTRCAMWRMSKRVRRFVRLLRDCGAEADELDAFCEGLGPLSGRCGFH